MAPSPAPLSAPDGDACYRALQAHDARFDGAFFTAVLSTGIYCRPVCRVRLPRRENCRFYRHAAQAEAAGFRPCLRCRPELAPRCDAGLAWSTEDASRTLAWQAARLMDQPEAWAPGEAPGPAAVARRLGVSDRHLRRIFEAQFAVSPLQYLQTRRLLAAKQLLADTRLPMPEVALASGFASLRRFHDAFTRHYGLSPGALRRAAPTAGDARGGDGDGAGVVSVHLGWRPPYDVAAMLDFLARRALPGVEIVDVDALWVRRTLRLSAGAVLDDAGTQSHEYEATRTGWLEARFEPARDRVQLRLAESLAPALPLLIARVRGWLDLDADPQAIHAVLGADFPHGDGLRVPGTLDGFELAVRAVLGQQITVAAARTLGARLVQALGEPVTTPHAGLDRLFPTPQALAAADPDVLGRLGIVRQRQAALQALARAVAEGQLALHAGADVAATCAALQALPGIGAWTAQYIALRALRWPDAFPAGDVALHKALGVRGPHAARDATDAAQAWRPWRGYAVLRAWQAGPGGQPAAPS